MRRRVRAVYGALFLAITGVFAVFVPETRSEPASALYVGLFGLAGVLYIASTRPPARVELDHLWGAGEASLGLALFTMIVGGEFTGLPWIVDLFLGTLVGGTQVWQGARRVRGIADADGSWTW